MIPISTPTVLIDASSNWSTTSATMSQAIPTISRSHHRLNTCRVSTSGPPGPPLSAMALPPSCRRHLLLRPSGRRTPLRPAGQAAAGQERRAREQRRDEQARLQRPQLRVGVVVDELLRLGGADARLLGRRLHL